MAIGGTWSKQRWRKSPLDPGTAFARMETGASIPRSAEMATMSHVATNSESGRLVEFLRTPAAYAERPSDVQVVETHISWVFLAGRYAYKLKKPVRFEFLDFSTPALRRRACRDEVRLNRRLAPDVYLDVFPVTAASDGTLQLAGSGTKVDWVVQMRRLPADRALDRLLREDRLTPAEASTVARFLAKFYSKLPSESVNPNEYRAALDHHIRANRAALLQALPQDAVRIRRIHSAQLRYLHVQYALFDNRVMAGRIVGGHGDLRPEHIYLERTPAVIDCIEFSDELRQVDTADELNFLAMECDRLGRGDFGQLVLSTYEDICGDPIPPTLSSFYRSYRACVRAKVTLLQSGQQAEERQPALNRLTRQYLDWADYDAEQLGPPCLLVVFGLMGTGKSTLARKLAEAFGAEVISTDSIRRSMWGASPTPAHYGEGIYRPETRGQVYDELLRQAGDLLDKGRSVILDGTFLARELRERANELSRRHGALALDVWCDCPRETALARVQGRAQTGGSESEARVDLYDAQVREFQPPAANSATVQVNTTADLARQLQIVFDKLRETSAGRV